MLSVKPEPWANRRETRPRCGFAGGSLLFAVLLRRLFAVASYARVSRAHAAQIRSHASAPI